MTHDLSWMGRLSGKFIVFDGPDGSGKTTQFRRFLAAARDAGLTVCEVREPGGTGVGEKIRQILLDHAHKDMSLRCEMMLYMASRAQLVEQRIRPALSRGELVAADRFVSSTYAYQGAAGGLPMDEVKAVARVATMGCEPDLVVIFDVDEATAAARINPLLSANGRTGLDRMEAKGREFHSRVRQGYLALARSHPGTHKRVDASRAEEAVWEDLLRTLAEKFRA